MWVPPGSSTANLVFRLGKERGHDREVALDTVRVRRCDDASGAGAAADSGASWVLYAVERAQGVSRIRYGEPPAGFRSAVGPVPLVPGCYSVQVSGTGAAGFSVAPNGVVTDEGELR